MEGDVPDLKTWGGTTAEWEAQLRVDEVLLRNQVNATIQVPVLPTGADVVAEFIQQRTAGGSEPADGRVRSLLKDGAAEVVQRYEESLVRYAQSKGPTVGPIGLAPIEKEALVSFIVWAMFRDISRYASGERAAQLDKVAEGSE